MVKPSTGKPPKAERKDYAINGDGSGRFKGVRMRKWGKWVAQVRLPKSRERIWLGSYETPEMAARAYDAAVFCIRGPSSKLNFPATPPGIPSAGELTPPQIQAAAARYAHEAPVVVEAPEVTEPETSTSSAVSSAPIELPAWSKWAGVDSRFSPESGDMFNCSLDGFSADCYFPAERGGEEAEDIIAGGTFCQLPRLWSF